MDPLQRVRLGTTDLEVTRVSLGCAPIGGLYSNIPDEQAQQVVSTALEAGINFIDTAALYGAGTSERRVGAALRGVARNGYVLATKVGWRFEHVPGPSGFSEYWDSPGAWMVECHNDYSADWVERSLENSLTRLGIDRLDVVHIHDPDEDEHFAEVMDGAYPVLDRLRSQGVIGAVGAGMNQSEMLSRLARAGDFDCFLLAGTLHDPGAGGRWTSCCRCAWRRTSASSPAAPTTQASWPPARRAAPTARATTTWKRRPRSSPR